MKHAMRRTEGVRWDRWRRIAMMQSLQMMVLSGVVRRAELYPHRHFDKCVDLDADPEASLSSRSDVTLDEQSWFPRFAGQQADSPLMHARNAT